MNGVAFTKLPQLVELDLMYNVCINAKFEINRDSNSFRRKILRNCGSADVSKKQISCITSTACDSAERGVTKCCELELGTIIEAADYTFAADTNYTSVDKLIIAHQQNVEFLPVSVHERFSNLKLYSVVNTPVQKISKKNFEKLFQLNVLKLDRNQIEVIKNDTFEDLVNLGNIRISNWETLLGGFSIF